MAASGASTPTVKQGASTPSMKTGITRSCSITHLKEKDPLRQAVNFSTRTFDVKTLPADMLRVYKDVKKRFDEEYALLYIFNMQTAMEMHRAWNMTLLTSKTLKQCSDTLRLNMHWNLGVIHLKFFIEDGQYELQRKVPYDYDSEFQDYYMKIASALYHGHLTVHEALIFQQETKQGKHTAKTGWFLRSYPGRLLLLPAMSATCAMIFFGGRAKDAGVAALAGLVCGLFDYGLNLVGGEATKLQDLGVGCLTGAIGGLFYRFHNEQYCLSAIFLGTMYWFFYGTAFVLGLLEILAGELETGVTRFMAVSIKTFVLCLMACFGMLMVLDKPAEVWVDQNRHCGQIDLDEKWWRIPLYLACSCSVLGQYRFRFQEYWRGLIVQWVGYEVQWQVSKYFQERNASSKDLLDVMASNIAGCAAALITAVSLSVTVDFVNRRYYGQLLQRSKHRDETPSVVDDIVYEIISRTVRILNLLGLGRKAEQEEIDLEMKLYKETKELKDPNNPRMEINLEPHEEELLLDTVVNAESMNIWSMLMPAVYQLVPGSMIAKFWFEAIIPPEDASTQDNMFAGLMVTSLSLALGLVIGDAIVVIVARLVGFKEEEELEEELLLAPDDEDEVAKNDKVSPPVSSKNEVGDNGNVEQVALVVDKAEKWETTEW